MKKLITIIITSFLLLFNTAPAVQALVKPPTVSADSVVLMDATTGKILYEKNKNSAYPPASTTKIMTILLVLENSKLDDVVTVSKNAEIADGSKIYITEGEKISVKELLYGLILASANDCAVALAEHISGSTEKFAKLMNEKAGSLGCKNTNFVNPNGLYDVNHKTSAYDLALIMQELTKHDEYKEMATTPSYTMASTNKCKEKRPLWNGNKLIHKGDQYYYEYCVGGKTGYTIQSKHSYIAVANKNGQKLIVSLVHDSIKTFFPDSIKLLNYGFNNFELSKYYDKGVEVSNLTLEDGTVIPLLASKDFYIVKAKGSSITPIIKTEKMNSDLSSIKKGDDISKALITFGKDSYNLDLSSGMNYSKKVSVPSNSFLKNNAKYFTQSSLKMNIIKYSAIALATILIFMRIRNIKTKKKNRLRRLMHNIKDKR
ncbi:D-alanyl-D-alanine carboxypeptidase [Clostridium bowmanii]|uniref:D-alanyl-D-alanine carboxypeptidase family protein n=1 Tax=Clostridium bowmanii TaxID=132925 RepID=UPI001C0B4E28|nr:D-alanyl-D-alanine carboxypeptidase family protein [Clostridium bowmanii]MBU3189741.1 D-alanyl-D-alanine carboxypeptidase [Clostridium bowmanii]MCA1074223.1 D-alanyl-D-alanine carboxypeptidase [Clostridium bowmanii]